jgi:Phosphatidylinositol N-acetylglucosaminyltransferase
MCLHVKQQSRAAYTALVIAAAAVTSLLALASLRSWPAAAVNVATHLAMLFVCPWCLLAIGKFKAQINGPWDEAVPRMDVVLRQGSLTR